MIIAKNTIPMQVGSKVNMELKSDIPVSKVAVIIRKEMDACVDVTLGNVLSSTRKKVNFLHNVNHSLRSHGIHMISEAEFTEICNRMIQSKIK